MTRLWRLLLAGLILGAGLWTLITAQTGTVPPPAYALRYADDCDNTTCTATNQVCITAATIYCCPTPSQTFAACGSAGGVTNFLGLTDTPSSYAGQALKVVRVNAGETALEFSAAGGGGNSFSTIGAAVADSSADTLTVTDSGTVDFTTTNDPEDLTAAIVGNSIGMAQVDETANFAFTNLAGATLASGNLVLSAAGGTVDGKNLDLVAATTKVKNVCASGCEHSTIQAAVDAISDASNTNRYVVVIHPGDYAESVTAKSYVSLVGWSHGTARITSTGNAITIPTDATDIAIEGLHLAPTAVPISLSGSGTVETTLYVRRNIIVNTGGGAGMASTTGLKHNIYWSDNHCTSISECVQLGSNDTYHGFSNVYNVTSGASSTGACVSTASVSGQGAQMYDIGSVCNLIANATGTELVNAYNMRPSTLGTAADQTTVVNVVGARINIVTTSGTHSGTTSCFRLGTTNANANGWEYEIVGADCLISGAGTETLTGWRIESDADHAGITARWSGGNIALSGGSTRVSVNHEDSAGNPTIIFGGVNATDGFGGANASAVLGVRFNNGNLIAEKTGATITAGNGAASDANALTFNAGTTDATLTWNDTNNELVFTGPTDSTGGIAIDDNMGLRLYEEDASGANYVELKGPATLGANATWTFNITAATCTGDGNGGALTVNGSNEIVCSADDGGAGGGTVSNVGNCNGPDCFMDGVNEGSALTYEGATIDTNQTTLTFTGDPGAAYTVTVPNETGTILTTASGQPLDAELTTLAGLTEAQGALIIGNATPEWSVLSIGGANAVLFSSGTTASWDTTPALACDDCTANTEAADDSTTQAATTAFVQQEINGAGGAGIACSSGSCATASGEQNFLASGSLTCGASTAGKMQVHTTPLQYCDNAGTPTLQYAAYGDSAGAALSGDSATSFFSAGTIDEARLDANVCLDNEASTWASAGTQVFNDPVSLLPDGTNGVTVNSSGLLAKAGTGSVQADDVVCTGCVVSADVASLDVSDDLNLTAGRSLTLTGDDVAADAELYTDTKCMIIESPADADNLLFYRAESAITVTGIDCLVNASTSAVITVQECNGNGASCTSTEAAITCATTNTTEASGIDDSAVDAGDWMRIDVGTVTGTVGHVAVCVTFTVND